MGLTKFGTGDVIGPDDENVKKEAAKTTWSDEDTQELAEENED
jgi:hypothetical protein